MKATFVLISGLALLAIANHLLGATLFEQVRATLAAGLTVSALTGLAKWLRRRDRLAAVSRCSPQWR